MHPLNNPRRMFENSEKIEPCRACSFAYVHGAHGVKDGLALFHAKCFDRLYEIIKENSELGDN